jgi:hypothetical protein
LISYLQTSAVCCEGNLVRHLKMGNCYLQSF